MALISDVELALLERRGLRTVRRLVSELKRLRGFVADAAAQPETVATVLRASAECNGCIAAQWCPPGLEGVIYQARATSAVAMIQFRRRYESGAWSPWCNGLSLAALDTEADAVVLDEEVAPEEPRRIDTVTLTRVKVG